MLFHLKPIKMIVRTFMMIILAVAVISCSNQQKDQTNREVESASKPLVVTEVMDNPSQHVDQTLTVEGIVAHVCQHGGKRLHISKAGTEQIIRVRTGKNMSPFDKSLEGSTVRITGRFVEERLDQEYLNQLRKGQQEAEHQHDASGSEASDAEGQGVSEAFIQEMQQKINNSEKGYITEYWLTAEQLEKVGKQQG